MDIRQARQVLGVTGTDGYTDIKTKYRKIIARYHPDTIGSDLPEYVRRAQEINEAYRLLKADIIKLKINEEIHQWKGTMNEKAYASRNIYMPYHADIQTDHLYQKVAHGKFMWDPDEEEFHMFLRSMNHASRDLLIVVEESCCSIKKTMMEELRFRYQVPLLYYLVQQYIEPLECLDKLVQPVWIDSKRRKTYQFRSVLGKTGNLADLYYISNLKTGELVFPVAMKNNRIMVADRQGNVLGNLILKDDALYFCLIPLLKEKRAQVKLTVKNTLLDRKHRPYRAEAEVELLFRLESDVKYNRDSEWNVRIKNLLVAYERELL